MKYILKLIVVLSFLFVVAGTLAKATSHPASFDVATVYAALAGDNLNELEKILALLKESTSPHKEAYEGALLMKKAGLIHGLNDKLASFKAGRKKLESAINQHTDNAEYRFLRLLIQENAPKILKYRNNIKDDSKLVIDSFSKLPIIVRQAVKDYSKKSKVLNNAAL